MKALVKIGTLFLAILVLSCGGKEEKKEGFSMKTKKTKTTVVVPTKKASSTIAPSKRIDLENKGVGPIKSLELPAEINQEIAVKGADIFKKMCTACHRTTKKFIGPPPLGILKRRSPEWVMNMILNPDEMVKEDQLAKDLLMEFNGSPMANQSLSEEEARAVLEYFRTL